jgi:hypothetical protein
MQETLAMGLVNQRPANQRDSVIGTLLPYRSKPSMDSQYSFMGALAYC